MDFTSAGVAGFCGFTCARAVPGYLGSIALLTAIVLAFPLMRAHDLGVPAWVLVLLGVLAAIPASDLAISLINRVVTDLFDPRTLPRLELKEGVPEHLRTMVVIPTLLSSIDDVKEQVARLEIHYLGNSEGDLRFALLTDWVDATEPTLPGDEALVAAVAEGIADLNTRHGPAPGRRRAVPLVSSEARVERVAAEMDGLGAQAGKAGRAEPAASRFR